MAKITEYPVTTEIANDDVLLVDGTGGTRGLSVSGFSEAVANNIVNSTAITGLVADIKADIQEKGDEVIDSIPSDYTALQGEVSDLKSDLNSVKGTIYTDEWDDVSLSIQSDGFYNIYGFFSEDTTRRYALVNVAPGERYSITTYLKSTLISAIVYFNDDAFVSYEKPGTGANETLTDYVFDIPTGVNKISVQSSTTTPPMLKSYGKSYNAYTKDNIADGVTGVLRSGVSNISLGTLNNGFVNSGNGRIVSADSYKVTDYLPIKSDKIAVKITSAVSDVGLAFYDDTKLYISGVDFSNYSLGETVVVDVPEFARYFVYSAINEQATNMNISIPNYANAISAFDTNPCFWTNSSECRVFKKILCIGDSLTEGRFDYNEGGTNAEFTDLNYAYPTFLKAISGRDTTNAGDAGETTVSWYAAHGNDDFSGHDACIIALGRNDYAGSNNVSSADRIAAINNIIMKVKAANPQIKIFVATQINYYKYANVGIINADMQTIVNNNTDCYLLDIYTYGRMIQANDSYSHCTAVGYYKLAQYIFNYISYIMHMEYSDFKTVQFIGTNRSFT